MAKPKLFNISALFGVRSKQEPYLLPLKEKQLTPKPPEVPFVDLDRFPKFELKSRQELIEHLKNPVLTDAEYIEVDLYDPAIPGTEGSFGVLVRFPDNSAVTSNTNTTKHGPIDSILRDADYTVLPDPVAIKKDEGGANRFSSGMFSNTAARLDPPALVSTFKQEVRVMRMPVADNKELVQTTITTTMGGAPAA